MKPSADDPVLLVVNGPYLHTNNAYIINKVREHNFTIVSLSTHSVHKMPPLDFRYMTPIKTYYAQEIGTRVGGSPDSALTTFVV